MMSAHDFDLKLKHIEEQAAARRESADAYRDQELARLFNECDWTQEKIAAHLGKKQQWVSKRLIFGRFLKVTPTGSNSEVTASLTERRFREHYRKACIAFPGKKQSAEKERNRFDFVLNELQHGVPTGKANNIKKPQFRAHLRELMRDGEWRTVEQMAFDLSRVMVGVVADQVRGAIGDLKNKPPRGWVVEIKPTATKERAYRMRLESAETAQPAAFVGALYERAKPLIAELEHWGRTSPFGQAPSELLKIAHRLKALFESQCEPEHA